MLREAVRNTNGWIWIHLLTNAEEHVSTAIEIAFACLCTHDKAVYLIYISVGPIEQK
jgi:hypothetical protein